MSLAWTQNGSGQFLVESNQHLLQIMNQGSLFADTGSSHPSSSNYWSSSYLQTSDIDLSSDHANIVPIGDATTVFSGDYNGAHFQIKNWSLNDDTGSFSYSGLFGYCSGASFRRIRLSGAWSLVSSSGTASFLCSHLETASQAYDVEGDFSEGTSFSGGNGSSSGALFGVVRNSSVHGASLMGTVDFGTSKLPYYRGGVFGYVRDSTLSHCRNVASFPNGIPGVFVGGISGYVGSSTMSKCLNAMTGDVNSTTNGGGIIGRSQDACQLNSVVNSMTGNIHSNFGGGIVGYSVNENSAFLSGTRLLNYMHGSTGHGGIVGYLYRNNENSSADIVITKSIAAIRGSALNAVIGGGFVPSPVEVTVDTSFGMSHGTNTYGTSTMVLDDALLHHPLFADLPYVDLSGTDPDGNVYDWDFVYANIGGSGNLAQYTHLSVHTFSMSAPLHTSFTITGAGDQDQVWLTYANADDKSVYVDANLTVMDTTADTVHVRLVWSKDTDGKFVVANEHQLMQLMSGGTLYTETGDDGSEHPAEYWSTSADTGDTAIAKLSNQLADARGSARVLLSNFSFSG